MLARVNALDVRAHRSIWTHDLDRAHRLAARVEAGYVWINRPARITSACRSAATSSPASAARSRSRSCSRARRSRTSTCDCRTRAAPARAAGSRRRLAPAGGRFQFGHHPRDARLQRLGGELSRKISTISGNANGVGRAGRVSSTRLPRRRASAAVRRGASSWRSSTSRTACAQQQVVADRIRRTRRRAAPLDACSCRCECGCPG